MVCRELLLRRRSWGNRHVHTTCSTSCRLAPYAGSHNRCITRLFSPIQLSHKTSRYCWPTTKCRNVCVQHACFEDKKAKETSPRKSTPRTLKQVGQQYPSLK